MSTKEPIPDTTILAAIDRAERHTTRRNASARNIYDHLAIPNYSRRVRAQLRELVQSRSLERFLANGIEVWALTAKGRLQLSQAVDVELPEAPQHRAWRNARALAEQEIGRFTAALRDTLTEALALLDAGGSSDAWFELADRLRRTTWRVGSATYCLHEWVEPTDEHTDIDECTELTDALLGSRERVHRQHWRAGRRNTTLWRD